jgi:hypothetical protein
VEFIPVAPELSVTAPQSLTVTQPGQVVTFAVTVSNVGQVDLSSVKPALTGFTGRGKIPTFVCPTEGLAAGASMECTASYTAINFDIDNNQPITGNVTVSGVPPFGAAAITAPVVAIEAPVQQSPQVQLSVEPPSAVLEQPGKPTVFAVTIKNTGNTTGNNPAIDSNFASAGLTVTTKACPPGDMSLEAGDSIECLATVTANAAGFASGGTFEVESVLATPTGSMFPTASAQAKVVPPERLALTGTADKSGFVYAMIACMLAGAVLVGFGSRRRLRQ